MTQPQGRGEVRALLDRHGLRPRKALGQHFLADPNIVRRIVRLSGAGPADQVIEIGAGTGTLTRALAATGATVLAFEVDRALEPVLSEAVGLLDNVEVRFEDAGSLVEAELSGTWQVVANLPYNVGTPLLLDLLRLRPSITRYVVMVQTEVAERLAARPGTKAFGLPSVIVDLFGEARAEFTVAPQVFIPPPQVGSAVVVIERRTSVPVAADETIRLAAAGFNQRRKMLRSSLRPVLDDPVARCEAAGIDPTRRAEELSTSDWLALAETGSG